MFKVRFLLNNKLIKVQLDRYLYYTLPYIKVAKPAPMVYSRGKEIFKWKNVNG